MNSVLWIMVIVFSLLSIIGSIFIVLFVIRRHRKREAELGIVTPKLNTAKTTSSQGKRWNRLIAIYLLCCLVFTGIILYQSVQGVENRELLDCLVIPVGALFFIIQAVSTRNTAIRRERATAYSTAVFLKLESGRTNSDHQSYSSIFEFVVDGKTYRVRYAGRYPKQEGDRAEIYYAPDDPNVVYIPELEYKIEKYSSVILFAFGILLPVLAVLAPLFR